MRNPLEVYARFPRGDQRGEEEVLLGKRVCLEREKRETDRLAETGRQTDSQTCIQRNRYILDIQTDMQADKQRDRQGNRDRQTKRQTNRDANREADSEDKWAQKSPDRQRQTGILTEK